MTARTVLTWLVALPLVAGNFTYWYFVATKGQARFRQHCAEHYGVRIVEGYRGTWRVYGGSWPKRLAIEGLQIAYFMAAFMVWGALLFIAIGVLVIINRFVP
jgi:hypothetical protein